MLGTIKEQNSAFEFDSSASVRDWLDHMGCAQLAGAFDRVGIEDCMDMLEFDDEAFGLLTKELSSVGGEPSQVASILAEIKSLMGNAAKHSQTLCEDMQCDVSKGANRIEVLLPSLLCQSDEEHEVMWKRGERTPDSYSSPMFRSSCRFDVEPLEEASPLETKTPKGLPAGDSTPECWPEYQSCIGFGMQTLPVPLQPTVANSWSTLVSPLCQSPLLCQSPFPCSEPSPGLQTPQVLVAPAVSPLQAAHFLIPVSPVPAISEPVSVAASASMQTTASAGMGSACASPMPQHSTAAAPASGGSSTCISHDLGTAEDAAPACPVAVYVDLSRLSEARIRRKFGRCM